MYPIRPARNLGDPYRNPELFEWLDSLEGVPDWLGPAETDAERKGWAPWQRTGNHYFGLAGSTLPGLALAGLIALAGQGLADLSGAAMGGAAVFTIGAEALGTVVMTAAAFWF